jgi:hypothetical protein
MGRMAEGTYDCISYIRYLKGALNFAGNNESKNDNLQSELLHAIQDLIKLSDIIKCRNWMDLN